MSGIGALVGAIALIALGGLFAAIDSALSTVSMARVEEMVRDERPGAVRLASVIADRPRYINLIVLLRITCEAAATVLLVAFLWDDLGLKWGLVVAAAVMVVISFVAIGVVLSVPVLSRGARARIDWSVGRTLLLAAYGGLVIDVVLKTLLAPTWQRLLLRVVGW